MKGSYILVIALEQEKIIKIGSLGKLIFPQGFYLYVGSAMGRYGSTTLLNRVKRHLLNSKIFHWHIDYFLKDESTSIRKIYLVPSVNSLECVIARDLLTKSKGYIRNFGSSDCKCPGHLFWFKDLRNINI